MPFECSIDTERCGYLCTGYDGSDRWEKLHNIVDGIECETCRNDGKKLMVFAHDMVNLGLGKHAYDSNNFHSFVDKVNCLAASCKKEGRC